METEYDFSEQSDVDGLMAAVKRESKELFQNRTREPELCSHCQVGEVKETLSESQLNSNRAVIGLYSAAQQRMRDIRGKNGDRELKYGDLESIQASLLNGVRFAANQTEVDASGCLLCSNEDMECHHDGHCES